MYVIRRVFRTQPGKAWEVASYLVKITQAYEEAGRSQAQVYINAGGLPGTFNMVYAEWMQERIEPTDMRTVPEAVGTNSAKMYPLVIESSLEFYELVTPEELESRGLA